MGTLAAHNLVKRYGSKTAVHDVSLEVHSGEVVGLLGRNGAGKTTSFEMIAGLVPANDGRIELNGRDVTGLPMHARARLGLGFLPQQASVFRKLSVADNIMAILEVRAGLRAPERTERLNRLMAELDIEHLAAARGDTLSGGERRRVEIARALASEPEFMLLDEPFAGVDPISISDIQGIIRHLSGRGIGVLVIEHHWREVFDICDRAYVVETGRTIAAGTSQALLDNAKVRAVYLGNDPQL